MKIAEGKPAVSGESAFHCGGQMLGALVMGLVSVAVVLAILILVIGVWPVHWGEVVGFTLLGIVAAYTRYGEDS